MYQQQSSSRREEVEQAAKKRIATLREELERLLSLHQGDCGLEIGCGHGHWLNSIAQAQPETLWIGADLISKRIEKAKSKANKRGLTNVHFYKAEATELLTAWPDDNPIHSVFLLYPDPWPKKRHTKNRLTRSSMLDLLAQKAAPGCVLYFRTDDAPFYEWTKEQIAEQSHWQLEELPWPHEHGSYFQDMLGIHGSLTARLRS